MTTTCRLCVAVNIVLMLRVPLKCSWLPAETVLLGSTLYIPALLQNQIFAVQNALTGSPSPATTVFSGTPLNQASYQPII